MINFTFAQGQVTILWSSWDDADSGTDDFTYKIFKMGKDENGQLSERTPAVASGVWGDYDDAPAPTYTPQETGMYRFVLLRAVLF